MPNCFSFSNLGSRDGQLNISELALIEDGLKFKILERVALSIFYNQLYVTFVTG